MGRCKMGSGGTQSGDEGFHYDTGAARSQPHWGRREEGAGRGGRRVGAAQGGGGAQVARGRKQRGVQAKDRGFGAGKKAAGEPLRLLNRE